ncbi:MAG: AmmeMemoRadiSam system protein A [Thauera sp.]
MPDADLGPQLLRLAREAIAHHLGLGPAPVADAHPALGERGATFVTLTVAGEMRGSVGSMRRTRSLAADVVANAIAACQDPRFPALDAAAFAQAGIEVSLLDEPEFIDFADEADLLRQLRPHQDGVMLFAGCRGVTLLPAMWAQLPRPELFLAALKEKAGIPLERPVDGLMAARYGVSTWRSAS